MLFTNLTCYFQLKYFLKLKIELYGSPGGGMWVYGLDWAGPG